MLLLDTCCLLWLAADQDQLSAKAKKTISKHQGSLFISAISAFEIAVKTKKGKLSLPDTPQNWFALALKHHGIQEIEINSSIALLSVTLPAHHSDPCDRFIMATSLHHKIPVLTPDAAIHQYENVDSVWD